MTLMSRITLVWGIGLCVLSWAGQPTCAQGAPAKNGAQQDKAIDLRPKFVAGRNAVYESWSRRELTLSISIQNNPPRQMSAVNEVDGQMRWNVDQVNEDGTAVCTLTIEWLRIKRTDRTGETVNDSREAIGDDETRHRFLQAMTGVPLRVRCRADGSIEGVEGIENIATQLDDKDDAPDETDWMESATELATIAGPPAGLQVGGTWNMKYDWNHEIGKLHHDVNYKVASIETISGIPVATVTGQGTLRFEPDLGDLPNAAEDISMTKGSVEHQVIFDLQRHEAVGRNTVEQRTIQMTRSSGDFSATQTIDETIQSQVLRIVEQE